MKRREIGLGKDSDPAPPAHVEALHTESLTVGGVSSELHWQEDDNSPLSLSGDSSYTFTLSGEFDVVHVQAYGLSSTGSTSFDLQVNGETGSTYDKVTQDGTFVGDSTEWAVGRPSNGAVDVLLTGTWGGQIAMTNLTPVIGTSVASHGDNDDATSPLDSITLSDSGGSNFSGTLEVYGRSFS